MLPKKHRADKKNIDLLFNKGTYIASSHLAFRFIITPHFLSPRISFVAPKSVARLAVKRNFLRRRGYRALQKYINNFPAGLVGVFVFRKSESDNSTLEHEIKNILSKIN